MSGRLCAGLVGTCLFWTVLYYIWHLMCGTRSGFEWLMGTFFLDKLPGLEPLGSLFRHFHLNHRVTAHMSSRLGSGTVSRLGMLDHWHRAGTLGRVHVARNMQIRIPI